MRPDSERLRVQATRVYPWEHPSGRPLRERELEGSHTEVAEQFGAREGAGLIEKLSKGNAHLSIASHLRERFQVRLAICG